METIRSHDLITTILSTVFLPEYRRLGDWIGRLCSKNREAHNQPDLAGFVYNGLVYKPVDLHISNTVMVRRALHTDLTNEMESYLKDTKILEQDKAFISQNLFRLIDPCKNMQDVRDALPNCLADTLPSLNGLTRGRQEAWSIADNPRAMRQYEKILPRIEMYAAARLMY